jgi:hypothetical protein
MSPLERSVATPASLWPIIPIAPIFREILSASAQYQTNPMDLL